ncbi:hypothetical protein RF11_08370 [Thelohanellus kitauei]|uniref:Uncharacterized protein n=1 Tax=Thelohanellus kitauei TaxID=669202 RepID=A0A0C2N7A6_THEKT|nr:hypothetical protein RF11_08370 [Thelohanellus kitauei]
MICVSADAHKVIFVNENAMLYLYKYYNVHSVGIITKFWKIFHEIYDIVPCKKYGLCFQKLTGNINLIWTESFIESKNALARISVIVFRMIHRLRLFDDINFNVDKFYDITVSVLSTYINIDNQSLPDDFKSLPNIWFGIFNGKRNIFLIDSIDKLVIFGLLSSISLSRKLTTTTKFEMTKKMKQNLIIIYFALVAFPIIEHEEKPLLNTFLVNVHNSFKNYIDNGNFVDISIENQFFILQNYLKCAITLNKRIPYRYYTLCGKMFKDFYSHSSLSTIII